MTLVVWDGKTLAADRLVSTRFSNNAEASENIKYLEATKIHTFVDKEILFTENDFRLLAIGYSGNRGEIEHFHEQIFHSDVFGNIPLVDKIKMYRNIRGISTPSSLSIYSSKRENGELALRHLVINSNSPIDANTFSKEDMKEGIIACIGSGSHLVKSFSKLGKMGSKEIIRLVSLFNPTVGNGLNYITPGKSSKVFRSHSYTKKEREKHIRLFSNFVLNASIEKE